MEQPLPVEADGLFGRAREQDQLAELVESGRLVTIVGPGGVGKTRLAAEFGASRSEAIWVDMTSVQDEEGLASTLRATLDLATDAAVVPALSERDPGLLILDNVEQVIDVVAEFVERLLTDTDWSVLATSREPLQLKTEQRLPLGPLDEDAAIELFEARARLLSPDFRVDDENRLDVGNLIRRVDSLPLAIELAATRITIFPPDVLNTRLEETLGDLSTRTRDVAERQRSLAATFEWSWSLLSEDEQDFLARVALFVGPFDLADAESVAAAERRGRSTLTMLQSLIEKSLLTTQDLGDSPAFRVLETLREFALAKLRNREDAYAEAARRHLNWSLAQASSGAEEKVTAIDNLLAAYRRVLDLEPRMVVEAADDLWDILERAGRLDALLENLEALHALPEDIGTQRQRVSILRGYAFVSGYRERSDRATRLAEKALTRARELDDEALLAACLTTAGGTHFWAHHYDQASKRLQEVLDLVDPESRRAAVAMTNLGIALIHSAEPDPAVRYARRAVEISDALGDEALLGRSLTNLAIVLWFTGGLKEAADAARRAAEIATRQDDDRFLLLALERLGDIRLRQGDDSAIDCFARAVEKTSDTEYLAQLLLKHGGALEVFGHDGMDEIRAGAEHARRDGHESIQIEAEFCLGEALLRRGELEDARGAFQHASALCRQLGEADQAGLATLFEAACWIEEENYAEAESTLARAADCVDDSEYEVLGEIHGVLAKLSSDDGRPIALPEADTFDPDRYRLSIVAQGLAKSEYGWHRHLRPLHEWLLRHSGAEDEATPERGTLILTPEAREIRLPGGDTIDLSRRGPIRRVLAFLAENRLDKPGTGAPVDAILEAGWPDEEIEYETGLSRVYTTIRQLRNLGLDELLLTRDDGYLLDPDLPIRLADAPPDLS